MENGGTRRVRCYPRSYQIPGIPQPPEAKKVIFRASPLPRALHLILIDSEKHRLEPSGTKKKQRPGYMVSQFQRMVLEEKSPANRPSFADVRRRNNEVSLRFRFCETGKPRRFTPGASVSAVPLVQSVPERLFFAMTLCGKLWNQKVRSYPRSYQIPGALGESPSRRRQKAGFRALPRALHFI